MIAFCCVEKEASRHGLRIPWPDGRSLMEYGAAGAGSSDIHDGLRVSEGDSGERVWWYGKVEYDNR